MCFSSQLSNLPTFNVQTELVFSTTSALFLSSSPEPHTFSTTYTLFLAPSFEGSSFFNNLRTLYNVKFRLSPAESITPALFCKIYGVGIPLRVLDSRQKLDGMGDMQPSGFRPWTPAPCSRFLRGNACA